MSYLWSDGLARLGCAFGASVALHVALGFAIEALPWTAPGAAPRGLEYAQPLQVAIGPAAQPAAPAQTPVRQAPAAAAASRYFLARELDARPAPLERVDPAYPNDAFLRDISGRVVVRLYLQESGAVEKVLILHAEPPGYFEEAVEQAFRAARFTPAIKNGRPVKAQVVIEVRYDSPRQPLPR